MQQERLAKEGQNHLYVPAMRIVLFLIGIFWLGCSAGWAADAVPATAYFPVLPFDAPPEASAQLVPVAANHALDGAYPGVTRAVIVIHDEARDANAALASIAALAGAANATTMIIAPQFLLPSDLTRFADHLPDQGHAFATWPIGGWMTGDDSTTVPGRKSLSSFTVVDLLLMTVADHEAFPDLKQITIAGYGSGAVFVQHYAAFGLAADAVAKQNIDLRFIVAGAPSYLYLTGNRPLGGRKGFGRPDMAICPDYNAYPYGLEKLNAYARRVGANAAKSDYALRFVTYLNAPTGDAAGDSSCAALTQGLNNTQRAANYGQYLHSLYGEVADKTQIFSVAQNVRGDAVGLFGSACGMSTFFGDGSCAHSSGDNP